MEETAPRIQQPTSDLKMLNALLGAENEIADRQSRRVRKLAQINWAASPDARFTRNQTECRNLIALSQHNDLDIAAERGTIAAYEEIGFNWAREWAKAQDQSEVTEMETGRRRKT